MIIGRTTELEYLQKMFDTPNGALVTLYGCPGVGVTSVWREFVKDKKYVYIKCPKAGSRQINYLVSGDLSLRGFEYSSEFPDFNEILNSLFDKYRLEKFVFVFDDFENAFKADSEFIENLFSFVRINKADNRFLCLLVSHDTRYIENQYVSQIGKHALSINGFLKIRPVSFLDLVMYYDTKDTSKCMDFFSLLGGNIGFYRYFDINKSLKENIMANFLDEGGVMRHIDSDVVLKHLREANVYSTILFCLSKGYNKLNDIYVHTEFSRAKISVYLKNLMSLDIVEKVASFDTPGTENTMKGIYRISNPYINFWYRFVYPHEAYLNLMDKDKFYDTFISDGLLSFIKDGIPSVCREYLFLLNKSGKLPIDIVKSGEWIGKAGTIHFLGKDDKRNVLAAYCALSDSKMDLNEYEWFVYCLKEAKVSPDYIYLFSMDGFDSNLSEKMADRNNVTMIDIHNL